MHIAQVSPYFHPHLGGVESHVMDISQELRRRGHDLTVVTSSEDGNAREEWIRGLRVLRSRSFLTLFRSPVTPTMARTLRGLEADLYHAHTPSPLPAYFAARASETTGVPLLITYHCDAEIQGPWGPPVLGLYHRTLEAYTMERAAGVITTTQTYAATSRAVWDQSTMVIPNPVDVHRFHPDTSPGEVRARHGIPTEEPLVLFVGRLVPHKGTEYLLRAMPGLPAHLLIVGTGPREPLLRKMATLPTLRDKVHFAGRVSARELPQYYAACDLSVLPSTSRLEAFGIAALEAMASGKPVIVSDVPGVREVIEEGREGLQVDPIDAEDIAAKIRILLADEGLRKEMGRRAREKVELHFSLAAVVDRLEALYDRIHSTTVKG
ncbi:MAG: glycosyltransferase family 4 protein [Thermoplasmata archaeon]